MLWFIIPVIILGSAVLWGFIVSNVEQAKYTVTQSDKAIEIRDYAPKIIAQTDVSGDRKQAINQGFRILADYIFGNNTSAQKVAMTAPVIQQESAKIAMTAPVLQEGAGNQWLITFVLPAAYTLETVPKPNNALVKVMEVPGKRFAVIRFTGWASDQSLRDHTETLKAYIKSKGLNGIGAPVYAFYNPPWTLPFMRRNEVMIEIAQ